CGQHRKYPFAALWVEPSLVAKLDGETHVGVTLAQRFDALDVAPRRGEPGWILEQDHARLACALEQIEGGEEAPLELVRKLGRQAFGVHPALEAERFDRLAQVLRQLAQVDRVARENGMRFDVKDEPGRRGVTPALHRV